MNATQLKSYVSEFTSSVKDTNRDSQAPRAVGDVIDIAAGSKPIDETFTGTDGSSISWKSLGGIGFGQFVRKDSFSNPSKVDNFDTATNDGERAEALAKHLADNDLKVRIAQIKVGSRFAKNYYIFEIL